MQVGKSARGPQNNGRVIHPLEHDMNKFSFAFFILALLIVWHLRCEPCELLQTDEEATREELEESEAEFQLENLMNQHAKEYEADRKGAVGRWDNLFASNTSLLDSKLLTMWKRIQTEQVDLEKKADVQDCQYLVGVFAPMELILPRAFHRQSWMQHPSVCTSCRPGCKIVYKFVIGAPLTEYLWAEQLLHNDLWVVDILENMNAGKTYAWFKSAASMPRYKAVFKMDLDSRISVAPLLQHLQAMTSNTYYGTMLDVSCKVIPEYCPPTGCKGAFSSTCWTYASGALYGLSQDLVQWIATDNIPLEHKEGFEDLQVGLWLHLGKKLPNVVNQRRGPLWQHSKHYAHFLQHDLEDFI